jgi:transposase
MAQPLRDPGSAEQYWRRVVALWRKSGLSVAAYCRLHNLSQPSLYWWRREIERRDQAQQQFLPIHVVDDPASSHDANSLDVVLANGRCVRVRPGFDRATLLRLLDALEEGDASC